MKAPKDLDFAL